MKKILICFSGLCSLLLSLSCVLYAKTETFQVNKDDIREGFIAKRIWLQTYQKPEIIISGISYVSGAVLPHDAKVGDPKQMQVVLGMERKQPFVVVRVPAFAKGQDNNISQLAQFTLDIQETPASPLKTTKTTTDVTNSVLADGTWYKIAVSKTGIYKLDAAFFASMGIDLNSFSSSDIRIFGNGGVMLAEGNSAPRITDLAENALIVNDGGDGKFNNNDYLLFYAVGSMGWDKDSLHKRFTHRKNLYSDTAYYFITVNKGAGKRVQQQQGTPAANVTVSGFDYYDVHENDLVNPSTYGKTWYGEVLSQQVGLSQSLSFDPGDVVGDVYCKFYFGCTQENAGSSVSLSMNGTPIGAATFYYTATTGDAVMTHGMFAQTVPCNTRSLNFTMTLNPAKSGIAYLDYVELNCRRSLNVTTDQLNIRDWQTVGAGKVASYPLQGASGATWVLDVTDPQEPVLMNGSLNGGTYTFSQDASRLHEFAVSNNGNFFTPKYIGKVNNQNLHGLPQTDLIIVVNPAFTDAANKLADFHRNHDHLRVAVATTTEVFNEFSSGSQDISAIRDFARMFYVRAGSNAADMPTHLLLFGNGSYDYKDRLPNNTNFVPTYETANDSSDLDGFLSDDFFGFLDDSEDAENWYIVNTLDIGVGRIPCRNATDAMIAANKAINYKSAATLGSWRINAMFAADDNDGAGNHMIDAEVMSNSIATVTQDMYNNQKVYVNAIPKVSTPAGERCPNANAAINEQIYKGVFVVNYNGHGNPEVWAGERILTQDDYNYWNNAKALPFMTTATCDFGQFDHPNIVSAAEQLVLRENGGVIAIITTTGAVFETWNQPMNQDFLNAQFARNADQSWNTFGDAVRASKNTAYITTPGPDETANFRKFALLGDPALTPDFPEFRVRLDSIIDGATGTTADTVKALGKYIMKGSVVDNSTVGQRMQGFNGTLTVAFYDKSRSQAITSYDGSRQTFSIQDNLIYKGKVSVVNGEYSLTFIAPKDINYLYGKGKLSTYAENGTTDASGADTTITIGGFSDHPVISNNPPVVRAYINDSLFRNGGITGTNTSLYLVLTSETGINVSGYSIGHNLTAYLDDHIENPYILNDYYETAPNTYQLGYVQFPLLGVANGKHTMHVRAWDVNNTEGTGSVDFTVVDGKVVDIQSLGNYPNPFSSNTRFVFEHNHPDEQMDVTISIYSTSGGIARTLKDSFTPTGSRTAEITWDGKDDNGGTLPDGVYVYRLNISTEKGFNASAYQKLVIVR